MTSLVTLIKCLPIILGLITSIQKAIDDAKSEQEVKDHLAKVKDAFDKKDASALDALFNQ